MFDALRRLPRDADFRWNIGRALQTEDYAGYVAFAKPVDLPGARADFPAGTADLDPKRSGHYDRYRLLVGY